MSQSLSPHISRGGSIVILRLSIRHPATTTGLCSFRNCHIHNIHIHPITNIGTRSFVAVIFVTLQPRRVYCHPGAVAFVTISPTTGLCSFRNCHIHHIHIHPITNIGSRSFVAVTFVTYQPRRVYCHPEAVAFVTLSPTSGLCSFRNYHIHHIHIHPITNVGS